MCHMTRTTHSESLCHMTGKCREIQAIGFSDCTALLIIEMFRFNRLTTKTFGCEFADVVPFTSYYDLNLY